MVTLKNIAENAGVSIGTVSTVLNKKLGAIRVSPATQSRVIEVAKRLKYMPNTMARGLRTGRSYMIGVMIPSAINTSFVPELIQGIEEVLLEKHLGMLLLTYKGPDSMGQMVDFMQQKHVDAAIVLPDTRKEYWPVYERLMKNQPTVGVGGSSIDIDLPRVYVCPKKVGEIAVDYLQQLGHKKIGILSSDGERYQFLLKTLEQSGIPHDPDLHILNCSDFESGQAAVKQYISRKKLPTAVFCRSDEIAAGFISGAVHNGIKIPDQISVIGTNDTNISRMLTPLLTSIGQPKAEQGIQAAKMALNLIAGIKADNNQIVLSPYLVKRESCKSILPEG